MNVFGRHYAGVYDNLYGEKDYAGECGALERAFGAYAAEPVRSVLDLGCGTGSHALPLARGGYEVVGVDRSEGMLARFREKAEQLPRTGATCVQGDVRSIDLARRFDAAVMMFAVLGYQTSNEDALGALRTVRRHLRPGGVFLADFWYGPAVLNQRPGERIKIVPSPKGRVIRVARGNLDERRHLCSTEYDLWQLEGNQVVVEEHETHDMRYFFPLELELLLGSCGLEMLHLGCFPDLERQPDNSTWTAAIVARATA